MRIDLNIRRKGNKIICSDLATLGMVLGSKAVAGNLKAYNVKKQGNEYIINIKMIKYRLNELEKRKKRIEEYLNIMRQVVS